MRLSTGFWQTYKEAPNEATIPGHILMMRAGLIQKAQAGLYHFLPLGLRSLQKVEAIVRQEMNNIGALEVLMSMVTPGELWQESGRWENMENLMLKCKDRAGRDICLSPTNEEAVVDIFRKTVKSYKQLPLSLYQINTKFRDEIRPRFGLMRAREFIMKDAYSFHANWDSLDSIYDDFFQAYSNIFKRLGLDFIVVEADAGAMGDSKSKTHEFQVLAHAGEDKIIFCEECGHAANIEKSETKREAPDFIFEEFPIEEIETGDAESMEEVSKVLGLLPFQGLKSLIYSGLKGEEEELVMAVLLGDDQVNELKLKNLCGYEYLRVLAREELKELGFIPGQMGPQGPIKKMRLILDSVIPLEASFFIGANKKGHHLKNFIPQRDLQEDFQVASLRLSRLGDICPKCPQKKVKEMNGIEVGHIFQLGDKYTKALNAKVLDQNGREIFPVMGCYGIGISRIVAAAIEQHHDEAGIVWPMALAPFQVHLVSLAKSPTVMEACERIYKELLSQGIEVLFDDRPKMGAGFKFKDADLLGLPLRVVVGERDYLKENVVELKMRKSGEVSKITEKELLPVIRELLEKLS